MTYGSLFTGIAGLDLGFERSGMSCEWQIEKDKDCNRVLSRHYPNVTRWNDVCEVTPERFRRVDVICGGFPCQDVSVAGQRKGLAGERSGLWNEFHRIIAEFNPRICVIENVPGLLSSNNGRDFLTIIRGMEELGYCVAWTVLDSQYRGVAQRRERVFIVGSLGNGSCAEILFEPESVQGNSPPSRKKREGIALPITSRVDRGGSHREAEGNNLITGTLNARNNGGGGFGTDFECDGGIIAPELHPALTARDCRGVRQDISEPGYVVSHALRSEGADASEDGTGRGTPIIAFSSKDNGADAGAISPTMRSMNFNESHINGGGQIAIAQTITAEMYRSGGATAGNNHQGVRNVILPSVRRLTPKECERLQGFPDDWTRWDAKGKEISDSARYRMIGNAVTVSIAEWIGRKVMARAKID